MRVLFYSGDKRWTGTARVALVAARGLAARGHHVTVACCAESRLEAEAAAAELDVIEIDASATTVGGAFDLRKVLAERFIEVAIVETERDQLILSSAMRFAERGAVLRRVPSSEPLGIHRSGRLALRLATAGVIVSTEREQRDLKAPGFKIPTCVVPLGVDATSYDAVEPISRAKIGAPSPGVVIACCYDPSGRQRMGAVFRALALLAPRHGNVHVVVFGRGSDDDELKMHAAALGVGAIITFLGEREDERALMRGANAGWVVAGSDTGALACLDFMALRVPVIAERTWMTQHYVADGITGVLLAAGDASYTASAVAAFLTAEDRRIAMGNAARLRVQREFTETAMLDGFERAVNAAGDRSKWAAK